MTESKRLPGHEQAASFWVGAFVGTEAVAVYIGTDREGGPYDTCDFNNLPTPLKLRILEACEKEFKTRRDKLLNESLEAGDPSVEHLRIPPLD